MNAIFDALGDRKRRKILEVLARGEQSAGTVVEAMQGHGAISQPAVSQHLKVLREAGLVRRRVEGTRRIYSIDSAGLAQAQTWLSHIDNQIQPFDQPLDALATEVARGKRERRAIQPKRGNSSQTG